MTKAPELKPCPFCGSKPYTDTETATVMGDRTGHYFAVACRNCEASAPGSNSWTGAVGNWNIRADLSPSPEAFQQMREALEALLHRHIIYCGGEGLPFAGHTDERLFNIASAALKAAEGD